MSTICVTANEAPEQRGPHEDSSFGEHKVSFFYFFFKLRNATGVLLTQAPGLVEPYIFRQVPRTYLIPLELVDDAAVAEGPAHRRPCRLDAEPPRWSTTVLLYGPFNEGP